MKYNDIELPIDLKDKNKAIKLLKANNEIILKLDSEYQQLTCSWWCSGSTVMEIVPNDLKPIWNTEFAWFKKANRLFDSLFESSSYGGHYKFDTIKGNWEFNVAEHYKSQMCTIRRMKQIMEIVRNRPSRNVCHKIHNYLNKLVKINRDFE